MSRNDAGRFGDAATAVHPAEHLTAAAAGEVETSVKDNNFFANSALASDRWASRPVSHVLVGPSRNGHSRSFNDPSNYLG